MPGDDTRLDELLRVYSAVTQDNDLGISFDKKVLEELIEQSLKFQDKQVEPRKTSRRQAIEAQKARKNAQT